MAFINILIILAFAYFIDWLEGKGTEKQNHRLEEIHRNAYAWVDENIDSPVLKREYKAELDAMVHRQSEALGREYTPPTLQEVTTAKERSERNAAEKNGTRYIHPDFAEYLVGEFYESRQTAQK